jgi:hypothetical protein
MQSHDLDGHPIFRTGETTFNAHYKMVYFTAGYISRSPGFGSRRYQILWEVVGLERDPLSLMGTTEELLGRKSSGSGLESREYGHRDPSRWPRGTFCPQKLALISPTSGGRSVGIVRWETQATEFFLLHRGTCGNVVVKDLCYMPKGRGFETRWGEWIFSIYLILPAALGSGVYSASNRNENQKQKNNVSGE